LDREKEEICTRSAFLQDLFESGSEVEREGRALRYEVQIGNTVFSDEIYEIVIERQRFKHSIETVAKVTFRLDKIDASRIDAYWPVIVDEIGISKRRVLYGVIVEAFRIDDRKLTLICEGSERYLKEYTVGYSWFSGFTPQEMLFYVGRRTPEIEVQEKNIGGLSLEKSPRAFKVIMPLLNFEIADEMNLLGLQLKRVDPTSEDEQAIDRCFKKIQGGSVNYQMWAASKLRLHAEIEATYFDEAALKVRKLATPVLDFLSYLVKLSILGFKGKHSSTATVPWNRDRYFTSISLGNQAYVRDISQTSLKACVFDYRT
jgi:hypothetical protein